MLVVTLSSCLGQSSRNDSDMYDIESALKSSVGQSIDELLDSIGYIPLETNEECVLTPTSWVNYVFADTSIIVLSDNAIYRFTYEGKYINKVSQRGSGPEDIGFLNQIVWNESRHELYAWDGMNAKLLVYDESLNCKKYIPFRNTGVLLPYKDYLFVGKRRDDFRKIGMEYVVDKLDLLTGKIKSYMKSHMSPATVSQPPMFVLETCISHYGDDIYVKEYRSDSVFKILPDEGRVEFAFGFHVGEIQPAELDYPGDLNQRKEAAQYIKIGRFYETRNYLFVTAEYEFENHYFLCSKQDGTVTKLQSGKHNAYDGGISIKNIIPIKNGLWLGSVIWPSSLLDEAFIEEIKSVDVVNEKARNNMLKMIKSLQDEDNPVIMFVKLKVQYE